MLSQSLRTCWRVLEVTGVTLQRLRGLVSLNYNFGGVMVSTLIFGHVVHFGGLGSVNNGTVY